MSHVATVEPRFQSSDVVLRSGVRLHYVETGPDAGPVVVMLHGFTDSSFSFSRVLPLMPPEMRGIAVDQRGHGDSDRPASGYSMDDFAHDALQLMDALRIDHATLVGHSMGSFVARRVAELAPSRVNRLVLVGTGLNPRNAATEALAREAASLTDPVSIDFIREFQLSTIARPVPPEFLSTVIAESRKLPARVWHAAITGMLAYEPRWPIACPTLVLGGQHDAVFSVDEQTAVFLSTERSSLHLEPGVGHTIHWEAPERFVALAFGQ